MRQRSRLAVAAGACCDGAALRSCLEHPARHRSSNPASVNVPETSQAGLSRWTSTDAPGPPAEGRGMTVAHAPASSDGGSRRTGANTAALPERRATRLSATAPWMRSSVLMSALSFMRTLRSTFREPIPQEIGGVCRVLVNAVMLREQFAVGVEDLKHNPAKIAFPTLTFNEDNFRQPHRQRRHRPRQLWQCTITHGYAPFPR